MPVTGLGSNKFTLSNGTITSLTGSGANYTLNVSPGTSGQVVIQLPAGQVQDGSSHPNYASNPLSVAVLAGPTLMHRWSFNGDTTDSVGGANATLVGTAVIANNQLQLPGGGPFANYAYVNIGPALSTNASLTETINASMVTNLVDTQYRLRSEAVNGSLASTLDRTFTSALTFAGSLFVGQMYDQDFTGAARPTGRRLYGAYATTAP